MVQREVQQSHATRRQLEVVEVSEFCVTPGPSREFFSETTPALDDSSHFSRVKGQISGLEKSFGG